MKRPASTQGFAIGLMMNSLLFVTTFVALASVSLVGLKPAHAAMSAQEKAQRLFRRLTGVPLLTTDPRYAQMVSRIQSGDLVGAAQIATADDRFYNQVVRHFASQYSNVTKNALGIELNDTIATFIGITRDDLPATNLLTAGFLYKVSAAGLSGASSTSNGQILFRERQSFRPTSTGFEQITQFKTAADRQEDAAFVRSNIHYREAEAQGVNLRQFLEPYSQKTYTKTDFITTSATRCTFTIGATNFPTAVPANANCTGTSGTVTCDCTSDLANYTAIAHPQPAGVLTARSWGEAYLTAGTNRRAVQYAMDQFLCTPMKDLADINMPDEYVRRDVDRNPGGSVATYLSTCRGCHAGMDSVGGAYAYFDFRPDADFYNNAVVYGFNIYNPAVLTDRNVSGLSSINDQKMNKNGTVFADGRITRDDSWVNYWTHSSNPVHTGLGWGSNLAGNGVKSFGQMLADSNAFSSCMVKRVFSEVCRRAPVFDGGPDEQAVNLLSASFKASNYKLKQLFENTAVYSGCIGR